LLLDESATQDVLLVMAAKRIDSLQRAEALRQATQRVDAAMSAGKLVHSQRDWALALAQRDPAEFGRWEAGAPQLVPLGRSVAPIRESGDSHRRGVERAARAEWQVNREFLETLCTEDAYVAAAVRE